MAEVAKRSEVWRSSKGDRSKILKARDELAKTEESVHDEWKAVFAEGSEGFLCWLNMTGWTFDPRLEAKHLPFITWPIQQTAGRQLWQAINDGHDILFDKSRDMGATWLNVAAMVWWWLFVPDTPMLMASRKEEYVDARGNPDTLFWKVRYLVDRLPAWLRPETSRRHMHLGNLDNGSAIDGESTNADLSRGGRRKAILLDEFASVEAGAEILAATVDTTPCRIFNSTPKGRANAFSDVRFSGKVQVLTLHWKDHPDKGRDVEEIEIDGKRKWTSPWYQAECARRTSRKEIAQELDIDYLASGDAFFDLEVCQQIRSSGQLCRPAHRGELRFTVNTLSEHRTYRMSGIEWAPGGGRQRLSLWCPLAPAAGWDADGPRGQELRPPQHWRYVAFADVSHGTGASNSVIKVAAVETGEEVLSFVCADTPPHELAHYAVAICNWLAGPSGWPLLGWEANGPGGMFGKEVNRLGYSNVLHAPNEDIQHRPEDDRMGWFSSRRNKENLLGDLRRALARAEVALHDEATITELEQYIYFPSGAIGPASLVSEVEGARAAHGDRVIAAAGLVLCLGEQPRKGAPQQRPAVGSFAGRKAEHQRKEREKGQW